MVVRLDLEGDRCALPEVEHAGVLARALEYPVAERGQPLQERRRVLVAAVLRPQEREDGQLEMVRLAAEELPDPRGLAVGEPEGAVKRLFRDLRQVIQCIRRAGWPLRYRGVVARRNAVMLLAVALLW